jgi:hypothetical protein
LEIAFSFHQCGQCLFLIRPNLSQRNLLEEQHIGNVQIGGKRLPEFPCRDLLYIQDRTYTLNPLAAVESRANDKAPQDTADATPVCHRLTAIHDFTIVAGRQQDTSTHYVALFSRCEMAARGQNRAKSEHGRVKSLPNSGHLAGRHA